MRTNIVLDDELVKEGLRLTKVKTKKELVKLALRELVQRRKRKKLLEMEGKVEWEGDLEEMRKRKGDPVEELYGRLAGEVSLTDALLEIRAREQ